MTPRVKIRESGRANRPESKGEFIGLWADQLGEGRTMVVVRVDGCGLYVSMFHPSDVEFVDREEE